MVHFSLSGYIQLLLIVFMKIPNPAKSLPLPPGDLGLPLIGQDRIFRQDPQHFREELYQKYGAISKTRLRGQNYIYLHGYEAVKFVLINEDKWTQRINFSLDFIFDVDRTVSQALRITAN